MRLQVIFGDIINPDQVGYLKGRFIGEILEQLKISLIIPSSLKFQDLLL